ncbi:hypothetical protein PR048_005942 [Dryococelus australis]|uniref:DUF4371 domain-containing protein n=1 Tax=Dryococelus australis TaxID=614101 RepID=A0ABQ9I9M8_9NEOP|nr:hypothetical protein PR048_005942 [Dryococelus australis]
MKRQKSVLAYFSNAKKKLWIHFQKLLQKPNKIEVNKERVKQRYINCKKAREKFKAHECSDFHLQAVLSYNQVTDGLPINAQLKTSLVENEECAFKCLTKILSTLDEGSFQQLLQMRAEDCPELKTFLKRNHNWCSPDIQNEMLQLLANELVRSHLCPKSSLYSVICDETCDVSGKEQMFICLRYIDEKLTSAELFVGLTTGEAISNIIFDVLIRLQLLVSHMRGQAYDGVSNMSGHKRDVLALVKEQQSLAPFIHCGAHSANFVLQDSCGASYVIKN